MIRQLAPGDAVEHLDVAAGTGAPGLTIAERSPNGRVVVTDISASMLAAALAHADDAARERIREQTLEGARQFEVDGALRIPLHARVIAASG